MLERMMANGFPPKLVPGFLLTTALLFSGASLLMPHLWFCAVIGLGMFFHLVWCHTRHALSAGTYGLIFGTGTGALSTLWLFDTLPLTTHGITVPFLDLILVYGVFSLLAFCFGCATALGSVALFYIRNSMFAGLLVAPLWLITEELRAGVFTLVSAGPQTPFEFHFSLPALAYPLTESSYLLQLADPFGIHGLSFALALMAGTIALLLRLRTHKLALSFSLTVGALVLLLPLLHPYARPAPTHATRVALISSTLELGESPARLLPLFEEVYASSSTDVIVFPENITPSSLSVSKLSTQGPSLIYSENVGTAMRTTLRARDGSIETQDKRFLVPFGEYLPSLVANHLGALFPIPSVTNVLKRAATAVTPGKNFAVLNEGGVRIGALLCSEILSPSLYKDLVATTNADILVNLSSRSWFHESKLLHQKIIQAGRIQAVSNRKPLLVATNGAPSFALSPLGILVASTSWGEERVLWVDVSF